MLHERIAALARRAATGEGVTRADALWFASEAPLDELIEAACALARRFAGTEVEFCSIVNARSGRCPNDCAFCAQSAHHNTGVSVFDLIGVDTLVAAAREAALARACRFGIVTSGPSVADERDFEQICLAVSEIAALGTVHVCASLGALTPDRAHRLKTAGLSRYHHNLETSARYYSTVCSTQDYAKKLDTLRAARAAGLEVCSGGLFGMGESWTDRVDLGMALRDVGVESVPLNFLVPIAGTPLENRATLSADEALRTIAVYRFIFPHASLRVCGGREAVLGKRQHELFAAGADAAMIGNYLTTPGRPADKDFAMVAALGLTVRAHGPG